MFMSSAAPTGATRDTAHAIVVTNLHISFLPLLVSFDKVPPAADSHTTCGTRMRTHLHAKDLSTRTGHVTFPLEIEHHTSAVSNMGSISRYGLMQMD
jgi:hypothetical protein